MVALGKFQQAMAALDPRGASAAFEPAGSDTKGSTTSRATSVKEIYNPDTDTTTTIFTTVTEVQTTTSPTTAIPPPPAAPIRLDKFWTTKGVWESGKGCYHTYQECQGKAVGMRMTARALAEIKLRGERLRACHTCGGS